jgi:hypothetical protein
LVGVCGNGGVKALATNKPRLGLQCLSEWQSSRKDGVERGVAGGCANGGFVGGCAVHVQQGAVADARTRGVRIPQGAMDCW